MSSILIDAIVSKRVIIGVRIKMKMNCHWLLTTSSAENGDFLQEFATYSVFSC